MSVELLGSLGNDLTIVNAARVSVGKRSDELTEADRRLIGRLMRDHHASPFEHVVFTFHVRCPIGVAREWQRHRDSYNELSTRYVEMEPDFYVPPPDAIRIQVGKAMGYHFEPASESQVHGCTMVMETTYQRAYESYQSLIQNGIAKELARNVLPLGLMTEMWWTVKLRAIFNFLSLRTAPSALLEIRQEAEFVEQHVARVVPVAYQAWVDGGRVSL